ncbi:hypothetical protein VIGAN_04190600 [Vigna angularis var. angularis]|uniref:DUF7906 domain-containing protein n=1 Tax=Vigna angularis var. angularis TaxID=157739 RepID=A0A0S3RV56_PHAAN|nr:hypothetical protein VIGAN_04190600 [Vigna angularis var. angularis]
MKMWLLTRAEGGCGADVRAQWPVMRRITSPTALEALDDSGEEDENGEGNKEESSPTFTKCSATFFTSGDRYFWIDLCGGPVDYGPAISDDGIIPRDEFHPPAAVHGRPKSSKACVADFASLIWSAYNVFLPPSRYLFYSRIPSASSSSTSTAISIARVNKAVSAMSHLDFEKALFYLRSSAHDLYAIHSIVYHASQEI